MRKIKRIANIFAAVAAAAAIIAYIVFISTGTSGDKPVKLMVWFPIVDFAIVVAAYGLFLLAATLIMQRKVKNNYTTAVDATCIENKSVRVKSFNKYAHRYSVPVYQFTLNGKQYTVEEEVNENYESVSPLTGDTRTLHVDENNPVNYLNPAGKNRFVVVTYVHSAIMIASGAAVLIFVLSGLADTLFAIS